MNRGSIKKCENKIVLNFAHSTLSSYFRIQFQIAFNAMHPASSLMRDRNSFEFIETHTHTHPSTAEHHERFRSVLAGLLFTNIYAEATSIITF